MNVGRARLESQMRQFCGACEAGVEHDCEHKTHTDSE